MGTLKRILLAFLELERLARGRLRLFEASAAVTCPADAAFYATDDALRAPICQARNNVLPRFASRFVVEAKGALLWPRLSSHCSPSRSWPRCSIEAKGTLLRLRLLSRPCSDGFSLGADGLCCRFSGLWYTEVVPVILQRGNEVRPLVGRFSACPCRLTIRRRCDVIQSH